MSCTTVLLSTGLNTIYSRPLKGTQIRLLALQPRRNDERLSWHLLVADLADKSLCYEAISYVWGSQETPATIYCKNDLDDEYHQLPIPQNAEDALEAVREPQSERLLWIDSICISQASVDEKSAQVAMMDSIFSNAKAVLIWLGSDEDFRPPIAAELFDRMAVWCRNTTPEMLEGALRTDIYSNSRQCLRYSESEVELLLNAFECAWVWRLWCVQEVVLAKKAVVHWARVKTPWDIFSTVTMYIQAIEQAAIARIGLAGIYNVTMLEFFRRQLADSSTKAITALTSTAAHMNVWRHGIFPETGAFLPSAKSHENAWRYRPP